MKRRLWFFAALLLLVPVASVVAVSAGQVTLSPWEAARLLWTGLTTPGQALPAADPPLAAPLVMIVRDLRLPRLLLSLMVGGGLAVSGAVLQAVFGNPLAEPYVLGVSAGAAFGAALGVMWQIPLALRTGLPPVPTLAFLGAVGATSLVYALARGKRPNGVRAGGAGAGDGGSTRLLLAGIVVSAVLSAGFSLIILFGTRHPGAVVVWLMGGFAGRGWESVQLAWPYLTLGLLIVFWCARDLNLLALGEESAYHLGVSPSLIEKLAVAGVTLIMAAAVAVSGLIGFVGLIVPHVVRYFTGPDHRLVLPGSLLLGAVLLTLADTLSRVVLAPLELPVGIITALCGGPFFLYLLYRSTGLGAHG